MATYDISTDALVIRAVEQGDHDRLLTLLCPDEGRITVIAKGAYNSETNQVGVAGDWTNAIWGTVEGVQISYSEDATLTYVESDVTKTVNLFQNNMFAVRAEIEVGFRADTSVFNKLIAPGEVSG